MLDEQRGREVLKRVFQEAGFAVIEEFPLTLGSFRLVLDGYDPERRVGYEYITTADGDREALHEAIVEELDRLNQAGLVHLFLIDEQFIPDAASLEEAARAFLEDHV